MRLSLTTVFCLLLLLLATAATAQQTEPPYSGTIFLDGDIITDNDRSVFKSLRSRGTERRSIYDRRDEDYITTRVRLFEVRFRDGLSTTVQVNAEFAAQAAKREARKYAVVLGRLPRLLRTRMRTVTINQGKEPYGGGGDDVLIHTGMTTEYERDGILEETLMHELTHTSIDPKYTDAPKWRAAQRADPTFISTYARDNPDSEDLAESLVPWFAVRYRPGRIDQELADTIRAAIPNRIAFFNSLRVKPVRP